MSPEEWDSSEKQVHEQSFDLLKNYFSDLFRIILKPSLFFRNMPVQGGMGQPLVFALVTHWLGEAVGFLWRTLLGETTRSWHPFFHPFLQKWTQFSGDLGGIDNPGRGTQLFQLKDRLFEWWAGAGPVIADPFFTLASILMISFLLFVGVRIFISPKATPDPFSYETALRVICFAMSPSILAALPFVGNFVASGYTLAVTVIGVREVYRISTRRALVIALFPKLIIPGIIGMGCLLFVLIVIKSLFSIF